MLSIVYSFPLFTIFSQYAIIVIMKGGSTMLITEHLVFDDMSDDELRQYINEAKFLINLLIQANDKDFKLEFKDLADDMNSINEMITFIYENGQEIEVPVRDMIEKTIIAMNRGKNVMNDYYGLSK
nr:MAG TPA: hypothetical protein [Caudoviricetes sp.]